MTDEEDVAQQHSVAARLAARAEIRDVRLVRTEASLHRVPDPEHRLTYDIQFDPNIDWNKDVPTSFVVRVGCRLRLELIDSLGSETTNESEATNINDRDVARMNFEFAALFDCIMRDGDAPLEEYELIAYATTTGQFALYPYIREYVYDTTGRLSLPPLTLGVLSRPMPDFHAVNQAAVAPAV